MPTIPFSANDMYYVSSECQTYITSTADCSAYSGVPQATCNNCKASQSASKEFQDAQQKRDRANAQSSDAMKMYNKELITLWNFIFGIAILVYLIYSNRADIMDTVTGKMNTGSSPLATVTKVGGFFGWRR
jgi:hypothetical protein